jgi:hypothetical protein
LRLERLFDIRGVNALGNQAQLKLGDADLTIVYGPNKTTLVNETMLPAYNRYGLARSEACDHASPYLPENSPTRARKLEFADLEFSAPLQIKSDAIFLRLKRQQKMTR